MVRDHRRDCNQQRDGDKNSDSKPDIEHQPADHGRYNRNGRGDGFEAKYVNGQGAEREYPTQEQKWDGDDVHHAVPGIAMRFEVIHKFALKIAVHTVLATALRARSSSPATLNRVSRTRDRPK